MVAKNNREVKSQKWLGNQQQHFALKHLTVGVASVLVGITITGASVLADSNQPANSSQDLTTEQVISTNDDAVQKESTITSNTVSNVSENKTDNSSSLSQAKVVNDTNGESTDNQLTAEQTETNVTTPTAEVNQWAYTTPDANGAVTLNNYRGTVDGKTIVIPNAVDFRNAGNQDVK